MKTKPTSRSPLMVEALEDRSLLSGTRHHVHHLHTVHHQHALHEQRRQESHRHHLHTVHAVHHDHFLHRQHRAHVLRTTVPEPIVLTAQERNDWATIREQVLANRKRVPKS